MAGSPADGPAGRRPAPPVTDDITPFERRKLWLFNEAHSLLAYAGSIRGHATVAEAIDDDICRDWVQQWWSEATPHLNLPGDELDAYCRALLERFANPRMHHRLDQIAADGSQKLPVRILPVLGEERSAGNVPPGRRARAGRVAVAPAGPRRPGPGPRADDLVSLGAGPLPDAVPRVLDALGPAAGADETLVDAVRAEAQRCEHRPAP